MYIVYKHTQAYKIYDYMMLSYFFCTERLVGRNREFYINMIITMTKEHC